MSEKGGVAPPVCGLDSRCAARRQSAPTEVIHIHLNVSGVASSDFKTGPAVQVCVTANEPPPPNAPPILYCTHLHFRPALAAAAGRPPERRGEWAGGSTCHQGMCRRDWAMQRSRIGPVNSRRRDCSRTSPRVIGCASRQRRPQGVHKRQIRQGTAHLLPQCRRAASSR